MKTKEQIQIDDREDGVLINILTNISEQDGFKVKVKRLKTGDYVFQDVAIERKTINDFIGSILDGRLKSQITRMNEKFKYNYVLVSGLISKRENKEFNDHAILGMLASLLVKSNVNVIMLENDKDLIYFVNRLFNKHREVYLKE